jgi:hypothetical protein
VRASLEAAVGGAVEVTLRRVMAVALFTAADNNDDDIIDDNDDRGGGGENLSITVSITLLGF